MVTPALCGTDTTRDCHTPGSPRLSRPRAPAPVPHRLSSPAFRFIRHCQAQPKGRRTGESEERMPGCQLGLSARAVSKDCQLGHGEARSGAEPSGSGGPALPAGCSARGRAGRGSQRRAPRELSALRTWAGARCPVPAGAAPALTRSCSRPLAAAAAALFRSSAACPGRRRLRVKRRVRSPAMGAGSPALRPPLPARAAAPSGSGTGAFPPAPPAQGRCAGRGPPAGPADPPRGSGAAPPPALAMCAPGSAGPEPAPAADGRLRTHGAPGGSGREPEPGHGSHAAFRACGHQRMLSRQGCGGARQRKSCSWYEPLAEAGESAHGMKPKWSPGFMRNQLSGRHHRPLSS